MTFITLLEMSFNLHIILNKYPGLIREGKSVSDLHKKRERKAQYFQKYVD